MRLERTEEHNTRETVREEGAGIRVEVRGQVGQARATNTMVETNGGILFHVDSKTLTGRNTVLTPLYLGIASLLTREPCSVILSFQSLSTSDKFQLDDTNLRYFMG